MSRHALEDAPTGVGLPAAMFFRPGQRPTSHAAGIMQLLTAEDGPGRYRGTRRRPWWDNRPAEILMVTVAIVAGIVIWVTLQVALNTDWIIGP